MYVDKTKAFKWLSTVAVMLALPSFALASGVSASAYEIHKIGPIPVTNSMIMGWVISILLILGVRYALRRHSMVPGRGQGALEVVVEGVSGLVEPIVGKRMLRPVFPLLIGLFCFVLIHNWSGLLPGVGSVGMVNEEGKFLYFFRPANADLNTTLALALVSFFAWLYYCLRYAGVGTIVHDLFGNKADKKETPGYIYLFLFIIFFGVGIIEIISILFRPVSLSFRLFGNVFGGENLLHAMTNMGGIGVLIPIPFYFLEVLIGLVQALVFTLLVAVYIGLICNHDEGDHEHH